MASSFREKVTTIKEKKYGIFLKSKK